MISGSLRVKQPKFTKLVSREKKIFLSESNFFRYSQEKKFPEIKAPFSKENFLPFLFKIIDEFF